MKVHASQPGSIVMSAVEQLFPLMAATYGPNGRGVLIDRDWTQELLDDGLSIINEFELPDELENAIIKYIRGASRKTNSRAGDGTTTAFLILIAILREVYGPNTKYIIDSQRRGVTADLRRAVKQAVDKIRAEARSIDTEADLFAVAKSSYANDEIAKIISNAVFAVGKDGIVTVDSSESLETKSKIVSGAMIQKGYINPHMALHGEKEGVADLRDPLIVVTDSFIASVKQIEPILEIAVGSGSKRDLLFICEELAGDALGTIVINSMRGSLRAVAIKAPGFGDGKEVELNDIAMLVGATVLSDKNGRPLSSVKLSDLGTAKKVVVTKDDTTIIDGAGSKEKIAAYVETLKKLTPEGSFEKKKIQERIAKFVGGVAVVMVGAATDEEMKTTKEKVEDAVNATQLAFRDGVVKGGGLLLAGIETDSEVLNSALKLPLQQLETNGKEALTDTIDPAGVVIAAIESAVSVGASLIDCGGIIAPKIEKKDDK